VAAAEVSIAPAGAKQAFLDGASRAYRRSSWRAVIVFFLFPTHDREERLPSRCHHEDTGGGGGSI